MIKPLRPYVLIEPDAGGEEVRDSGIIIPGTAKEKPQIGVVTAVYKGSTIKNGSKVYYKKWGGTELKKDGKDIMLIDEEDVLAVIV